MNRRIPPLSPRRLPTRTVAAGALAGLAALATACGTSASGASTAPPPGHHATAGLVLNVGDQQQNFETLMRASHALAGARYTVNFAEFDSGPLVDAAFAAHRIDVGFMGDLPASLAAKSHLPVVAAAVTQPVGPQEFLLARPGITSVSQLRGRPVAYTTGTSEQAFALRALKSGGLSQRDVRQVNVSLLQLGTVLEAGAADASVVSVEQKVTYEQSHPGARVLATQDTVTPSSYDYFLATKAAVASRAKRAAIEDFIRRAIAAENWARAHPSQWTTDYYVNVQHQTTAVAKLILAAGGTLRFVPLTAPVRAAEQNVVDLMAGAGAFPAAYSVAPLFDPAQSAAYNAIVARAGRDG